MVFSGPKNAKNVWSISCSLFCFDTYRQNGDRRRHLSALGRPMAKIVNGGLMDWIFLIISHFKNNENQPVLKIIRNLGT